MKVEQGMDIRGGEHVKITLENGKIVIVWNTYHAETELSLAEIYMNAAELESGQPSYIYTF